MKLSFNVLIFCLLWLNCCFSQVPAGYYNATTGLTGQALKSTLSQIITTGHTQNTYSSLWNHFYKTDRDSNNRVWDMYSSCTFQFFINQCGNYTSECDCYNREHVLPVSWMGGGQPMPMYADLHHIIPTDGYVNNQRANYPFGVVYAPIWTSSNGSKLGTNCVTGYNGIVFEPIDQYKGDFARIMFYMVTRYENLLPMWATYDPNASAVLDGSIYPALKPWALTLYLQWHQQDPVSPKEIARNDSIYRIQNNRNPFIDDPDFAIRIWSPSSDNILTSEQPSIFIQYNGSQIIIVLPNNHDIPASCILCNSHGQILRHIVLQQTIEHISISLSPGIFFIRCSTSDKFFVQRFFCH